MASNSSNVANNSNIIRITEFKRGPWSTLEDDMLRAYVDQNGARNWTTVHKKTGLLRDGNSCMLRWNSYLRPGLKKGPLTPQEKSRIIELQAVYGNKWSTIATKVPGRSNSVIKYYWYSNENELQRGGMPIDHQLTNPEHHQEQSTIIPVPSLSDSQGLKVNEPLSVPLTNYEINHSMEIWDENEQIIQDLLDGSRSFDNVHEETMKDVGLDGNFFGLQAKDSIEGSNTKKYSHEGITPMDEDLETLVENFSLDAPRLNWYEEIKNHSRKKASNFIHGRDVETTNVCGEYLARNNTQTTTSSTAQSVDSRSWHNFPTIFNN